MPPNHLLTIELPEIDYIHDFEKEVVFVFTFL
jgi:hypothetical protein